LSQGGDILMDIDLQGARQMLRHFPNAITIFIRPPSLAVLAQRLRERGTDDEATIALRLENAKAEMAGASLSRHVVVNDAFDQALDELIQLVLDYRSS
ncbi:MAG: guanylate kinase, partial [Desulfatitalea sp.]|nr:guanylate kinase [Desulfatitalea sp.]NNK00951.1 guanylate kinase [Desulfatitalea sp.]